MASAPIIILIIVVWLFVLAPWILRSQKPVSRTSEGFEATRVVFSGDSGDLVPARRPRPARIARPAGLASSVRAAQAADQEALLADAALVEPELVAAEELADEAVRARAAERAAVQAAEMVEGEVIAEDDVVAADAQQSLADAATGENQDDILDEDALEDEALVEDEDERDADEDNARGLVLASDSAEIFTSPVQVERAEDAYVCDEAYISPVDLFYPGAIDSPAEEDDAANAAEAHTSDDADADAAAADVAGAADDALDSDAAGESAAALADAAPAVEDSDNLSPEELAFAQRRLGRGGWDPEAEQRVRITRRQRRQRVLLTLVVISVAAVALGIVVGGWGWAPAAVAGSLTALYLVALRNQTRAEQELRRRRIAQLRRARLGVRNAQDEELDIPRRLRHPGAIVLEADDDSPDFHFLPLHYSDVDEDGDGVQIINRRPFEDELQARRVG